MVSHLSCKGNGVGSRFERCYQLQVKLRALFSGCLPTGPQAKGLWRGEYHLLTKHGECVSENWTRREWWWWLKGSDVTERKYQPKHKCGTNGTNWDRTWGLSEKSYGRHCQVEKMTGISVKLTIRKSQHLDCNHKKGITHHFKSWH